MSKKGRPASQPTITAPRAFTPRHKPKSDAADPSESAPSVGIVAQRRETEEDVRAVGALASEAVLSRYWDRPGEDEAWQGL